MLKINDLNNVGEVLAPIALAVNAIVSPQEKHAIKMLGSSTSGRQLLIVMPTAEGVGTQDNMTQTQILTMFLIEKFTDDVPTAEFLNKYTSLQEGILDLVNEIAVKKESECDVFQEFDESGYHIEPIYNEFGGWSGWALDLKF